MNIPVVLCHPDARVPEIAHATDAGFDFFSHSEVVIAPGERVIVPTGISMAIPEGYVGLIWDKSGVASKLGLKTMGGVIDAGYRGEIGAILTNTTSAPVTIPAGYKIAQLLIQKIEQPTFSVVENLDATDRGNKGFGSTQTV